MPVKSNTGNDKAKWIAIGVAAAALAAGAALYFLQSRGSEDDSDDESEVADEKPTTTEAKPVAESKAEKAPKLSKQHLLEILDALFSKTEELHKLVKEKLESQAADPTTLQKELETGMQQIEQQVHEKYDVDQQGLMLARQYYQEDPEVQAQILRLKKLFSPPDSDASLEDFMPKLRTHLDRSFENVQQAYDRVVEAGLQGEDAMTKMLEYAQEDAQKVQDESLKEIGMSEEDFTAACLKFQGHPEVMSLFQQVMQKQAALQLKLMGQA